MTREEKEALGILKYNSNVIHQTIHGETDLKKVEALDMAIKAIELLDNLDEIITKQIDISNNQVECQTLRWVLDIMNEMNVETSQGWIPVSERLPENNGYYRVTEKSGRVCIYVFHKEGNSEEYWKRCIIAWMPLSEAYKEKSEE